MTETKVGNLKRDVNVDVDVAEVEDDFDDFNDDDQGDADDDRDGGGDDDGDVEWVTVATFWTPTEAHIARLRLESEDIPVVVLDENLVAWEWQLAIAVGGIKLRVPAPDLEAAKALLVTRKSTYPVSDEPIADGQDECPRCKSPDIYKTWLSRRWSMVALFVCPLLIPFALGHRTRCPSCGFEWTG